MKKLLSITVVIALALSLTIPALANTGGGLLTGDTTVESVVLQVVVPTSMPLGLDPLAILDSESQVVQTPFDIVNNTAGVKVLAAFYLEATLAAEVELVAASALADKYDIDATEKEIYLGIRAAKEFAAGAPVFTGGAIRAFAGTTPVNNFGFILDEFIPADGGDPAVPGADAFVFHGEMNAYADWKPADVKIAGVYLLKALSVNTDVDTDDNGVGLIDSAVTLPAKPDPSDFEPPVVPDVTASSTSSSAAPVSFSIARTKYESDGLLILLPEKPATITSYTLGSSVYTVTTDYSYDASSGILTVSRFPVGNGPIALTIVTSGVTYYLSITLTV